MIIVSTRIVTYVCFLFLVFVFVFLSAVKPNVKHVSRIEPEGRFALSLCLIIKYVKTNSICLFLNAVWISVLLAAGTALEVGWFR